MKNMSVAVAAIAQPNPQDLVLSGAWTARGLGGIEGQLEAIRITSTTQVLADGAGVEALDTAGAWVLHKLLRRLEGEGVAVELRGLRPEFAKLLAVVAQHVAGQAS